MYRVRSDGSLKTQSEIRQENKNTSFPEVWTPELVENLGLDPVLETPQPEVTRYETAFKNGVEQDAKGNWVWKWAIGPVFSDITNDDGTVTTAAEQEAAHRARIDDAQATVVRSDRDRRLAETDWTQGKDIPNTVSDPWAVYRQALRDVPQQPGFPWEVTWPEKPNT